MQRTLFIYDTTPTIKELIDNGIRLWREEANARSKVGMDLKRLWVFASNTMDLDRGRNAHDAFKKMFQQEYGQEAIAEKVRNEEYKPPQASTFELLILNNNLVPSYWKNESEFPHKGLAISAFYFLESKNHLASDAHAAAWASLTMAYYYLGMNSSPKTAQESASKAATTKSANIGNRLRKLIVEITNSLPRDGSIRSASKAIDLVVAAIEENESHLKILQEFDSKTPAKTKKPKLGIEATPSDRLRNNLETWMATSSRYPEIIEAFAPFKRDTKKNQSKNQKT
jgi:hypothetical protein